MVVHSVLWFQMSKKMFRFGPVLCSAVSYAHDIVSLAVLQISKVIETYGRQDP